MFAVGVILFEGVELSKRSSELQFHIYVSTAVRVPGGWVIPQPMAEAIAHRPARRLYLSFHNGDASVTSRVTRALVCLFRCPP